MLKKKCARHRIWQANVRISYKILGDVALNREWGMQGASSETYFSTNSSKLWQERDEDRMTTTMGITSWICGGKLLRMTNSVTLVPYLLILYRFSTAPDALIRLYSDGRSATRFIISRRISRGSCSKAFILKPIWSDLAVIVGAMLLLLNVQIFSDGLEQLNLAGTTVTEWGEEKYITWRGKAAIYVGSHAHKFIV